MKGWQQLGLLLLLLAAISYWWHSSSEDSASITTERELIPDFIAEQLTRTVYDEDGQLSELMQAERMEHYEWLGFTQLEKPVFTLLDRAHNLSWQASSVSAVLYPNDKLILDGEVLLQNLTAGDLIDRVQTSYLEMSLHSEQLSTEEEVTIFGSGFFMHGLGMQANLNEQTIFIKHHIRTEYQHD
jgi:lipopolysaccharide export system protein LptC